LKRKKDLSPTWKSAVASVPAKPRGMQSKFALGVLFWFVSIANKNITIFTTKSVFIARDV